MIQKLEERASQGFVYGNFGPSDFLDSQEIQLVSFASDAGKKRLAASQFNEHFFILANFYQPQINSVYCGIASAVIVMNALTQPENLAPHQQELGLLIPTTRETIFFPAYSQLTFLNQSTEKIKRKAVIEYREKNDDGVYKPGLSISELGALIEDHGFSAQVEYSSQTGTDQGSEQLREKLKMGFVTKDHFFVIHFRCDLLGGVPKGHISPLAAYDQESDSVLILDVAGHKGPWYWAPLDLLYRAMSFQYDTQPQGGGLITISKK